ncbi:putative Glycosyltransferase [Vibrio chagasii]|nr:putative Glycosyltransferase [Vibrio chagasii]
MDKVHSNLYEKFLNILEEKQNKSHLDIRRLVSSIENRKVNIGYANNTLDKSFGYSLNKKFKKVRPFTNKHENPDFNLVTGQIWDEKDKSHPGALNIIDSVNENEEDNIIFFEQGFLSSASSWVQSFSDNDIKSSCLSYVYDDMAYYYMSEKKNRLSLKLNSEVSLSEGDEHRSKQLIDKIVSNRISKYNSQVIKPISLGAHKKKVLVIDQSFNDASTLQGLAGEDVFEQMLSSAIQENPDADIIVKSHPDSIYTKKSLKERLGFYSHLESCGRVHIYTEAVNPYSLFDIVDKVYVGTSGVGFEALMAGKDVICFGAPFYSGWGLTDDRRSIPHRHKKRSLHEVFYFTYVWYTHYQRPDIGTCQIEQVLDYILKERTCKIIEEVSDPKLSIIVPVYNVEDYIEDCIASIQKQTETSYEVIFINDASPDSCKEIIERYAQDDPRLKIINLEENIGQGFCRNIGIEHAKGEFVLFIDSDDYYKNNNFFSSLLNIAFENPHCDMVRYKKAFERVEDGNKKFVRNRDDKSELLIENIGESITYLNCDSINYNRHFWLFLYRRSLLIDYNIRFITTQWEERPFLISSMVNANSIYISDLDGIVYRVREDSTARRPRNIKDLSQQIENIESVCATLSLYNAIENINFELYKFLKIISNNKYYEIFLNSKTLTSRVRNLLIQHCENNGNFINNTYVTDDVSERSRVSLLCNLLKNDCLDDIRTIFSKEVIDYGFFYGLSNNNVSLAESISLYIKYNQKRVSYPVVEENLNRKVKLVVHPGTTKTGSTYLQHFFEINRFTLLKQGIYYPEFGVFWQECRPHKQAGHNLFRQEANLGKRDLLNKLLSVVKQNKSIDTVVLSSEAFYLGYADIAPMLEELKQFFDVQVVTYFREPISWANSQYCEFVSGGAIGRISVSFEEWIQQEKTKSWLRYDGFIKVLSDSVGLDNVIVREYERDNFSNGDLVEDFFDAMGFHFERENYVTPPKQKSNEATLTKEQVELMRVFNEYKYVNVDHYLRFVESYHRLAKSFNCEKKQKADFVTEEIETSISETTSESLAYFYSNFSIKFKPYFISDNSDAKDLTLDFINSTFKLYLKKKDIAEANQKKGKLPAKTKTKTKTKNSILNPKELSKFKRQYSGSAKKINILNFGFFGVRKLILELGVRFNIIRLSQASKDDLINNRYNSLFNKLGEGNLNKVNQIAILSDVYGFLGWRTKLIKPTYKVIYKIKGKKIAGKFKKSPIKFSRELQNPFARFVFRTLFPYGELVD